jgi:hypothetical protein
MRIRSRCVRSGLFAAALALAACAHGGRNSGNEADYDLGVLSAGGKPPDPATYSSAAFPASEVGIHGSRGRVELFQYKGGMYADFSLILVASARDKDLAENLLWVSEPDAVKRNPPVVATLDEYAKKIEKSKLNDERISEMRRILRRQSAIVYRYIHAP